MSLVIAQDLRAGGLRVEIAFGDRALKAAMKAADKSGSAYASVIGDTEIASGVIEIKRMSDGEVSSVKMSELKSALSGRK